MTDFVETDGQVLWRRAKDILGHYGVLGPGLSGAPEVSAKIGRLYVVGVTPEEPEALGILDGEPDEGLDDWEFTMGVDFEANDVKEGWLGTSSFIRPIPKNRLGGFIAQCLKAVDTETEVIATADTDESADEDKD